MINRIIPYVGYGNFRLYQSIEEAKTIIKNNNMKFQTELWSNSDCTNPVPWTIIRVDGKIHLFFAKNKLFKIYLNNDCDGELPNGITLGMPIKRALEIDERLSFDDWEEDYQSPNGYWIEDDLDNGTVMSISVFIREALDEDLFEQYEW